MEEATGRAKVCEVTLRAWLREGLPHIQPAKGREIPEKIVDACAKVIESDAPDDMKLLGLDKLGGVCGFRVTIDVQTSPQGNVDLAGSTGKTGIPPVNEPSTDGE